MSLFVDTSVWSLAFRRDLPAIDALLAQLCLRHDLTMLTAARDFRNIAGHCALKLRTVPT